jgi:transposase
MSADSGSAVPKCWLPERTARTLSVLRRWSLELQRRRNRNNDTCALANKINRICYATLRDGETYCDPSASDTRQRLEKKLSRERFSMPH